VPERHGHDFTADFRGVDARRGSAEPARDLCYRSRPRIAPHGAVHPMSAQPSRTLETFPNPEPGRDYTIRMTVPEFTCLCPRTGQPDFATIELEIVPDALCVELKSLKLYIWSYRDQGAFHEAVTNRILADVVAAIAPRFARVTGRFNVRGGIHTTVVAEHRKSGWAPAPPVHLP
jgi:7-cyano-7-deazaguanine reductase